MPKTVLLLETPAGFALMETKAEAFDSEDVSFKLRAFSKFAGTQEAVEAMGRLVEGKMSDDLKKFLKTNLPSDCRFFVADPKLAAHIHKKLERDVVADWETVGEAFRHARTQLPTLMGVSERDLQMMTLGLAHSLARHTIRFMPEQADTMIVQAVNLLDELDKELNNYCMRMREWYGWHFPELSKLVAEHQHFARLVVDVGLKSNFAGCEELAALVGDDEALAAAIRSAADISMGTDVGAEDLANMQSLARQCLEHMAYRAELHAYLVDRMHAIAPNLTEMVGELVGARLIAHAGSLTNLAKLPASTVQLLGAEKALFRALKAKHDTPKYGLIYHASIVGQASSKLKGKMARTLAAKTALAIRTDAFSVRKAEEEESTHSMGVENRKRVEERLRQLEQQRKSTLMGDAKAPRAQQRFGNVGKPFSSSASTFSVPKRSHDGSNAGHAAKKFHH